jgi:hypothetical protein
VSASLESALSKPAKHGVAVSFGQHHAGRIYFSTADATNRDKVTRQPSVGRELVRIFSTLREEL